MIAIGSSIGNGLFVASGSALNAGSAGGLLVAYGITGSAIYCTMQALGELACEFPVSVIAVIGFIILSVILAAGGGPDGQSVGTKYWHDPPPFATGFKGVASVFVTAAFSYGGTELVGLAAAEAQNIRTTIPRAIKQVFWRILMFYMLLQLRFMPLQELLTLYLNKVYVGNFAPMSIVLVVQSLV
ncbi:hypothetical protein QCA50_018733 [Cerrena zonata]|uniref:Amino acid permease/ SLC12A domain-containing protein n=1 Tax=Cerrena zonata TaxID=2478898 RepID=A0AAW0FDS5_9APHY